MITIEFLRSFKIGPYAIFDLAISFIGIYLVSPLLSKIFRIFRLDVPKVSWLYLTLPIGIIIHILIGNFTPMTKDFLDFQSHYTLKLIIIGLLILGLRKIKVTKK